MESIRRRAFIGKVATRAAYVAPAVLTLQAARKTYAGPSGCGQTGSPCTNDPDCCAGWSCVRDNGMACMGSGMCACE